MAQRIGHFHFNREHLKALAPIYGQCLVWFHVVDGVAEVKICLELIGVDWFPRRILIFLFAGLGIRLDGCQFRNQIDAMTPLAVDMFLLY